MGADGKPRKRPEPRFCAACGGVLSPARVGGRRRARCSACGQVLYRNPAAASAGVVLDAVGAVLLVRRAIEPYRGTWALPAGYQEVDETPEQALAREVHEEAGVAVRVLGLLDVLFVSDDPRKPANVNVYLCAAEPGDPRPGDDAAEAGYFPLDALPHPLGFDNYERILSRLVRPERYPHSAWDELRRRLGSG